MVWRRRVAAVAIAAALASAAAAESGAEIAGQGSDDLAVIDAGRSVHGRWIRAVRIGEADSARVALVVGVIHGDERAGLAVTRALRRRYRRMKGATIWVVDTINPDGLRARDSPQRQGGGPEPELPLPLARRRAAIERLLPWPAPALGARNARGEAADRGDQA